MLIQTNRLLKPFLLLLFKCFLGTEIQAQVTIYSENFESGGGNWTLNSGELGSIPGAVDNRWVVNNTYLGGLLGLIPNTANQPAGITGAPQSNYLHITNSIADFINGGTIDNANFLAPADGNKFAKMVNGISTIGFSNVSLSFWLLCNGDNVANNAYFGRTYYSIDGGNNWIQNPNTYSQISNWTQVTVSNPAFDNQADLRFAFMWVQQSINEVLASEPSYSIDDILLTGNTAVTNTITTGAVAAGPYCPGDVISVPFTSSGAFTPGNVYTAQLSNASGSFASPTNIGTFNGTVNSGVITATIPAGALAGTSYQIQVVSSTPTVVGTPNGANITINGPPTASITALTSLNICNGETVGFAFSGSSGNIQWQQSADGTNFTNIPGAISSTYTTQPLNANTHFRAVITNNCGTANSTSLLVTVSAGIITTITQNPSGNNLCNGPITLSIPNGFINIEWSNGQIGTSTIVANQAGDFSVTANTVSGCPVTSNTVSIIETTPTPLLVSPEGPITLCSGTVTLTAQSGFTGYNWNSGQTTASITVSNGGNFIVSAIDANGCPSTSIPVEVTIGSTVPITISPADAAICSGDPAVLTASTGFVSYLWSTGATTPSISVTDAGFYSVTGVDVNGCNGASTAVSVVKSEYPIANFNYSQTAGFTLQFNNTSQNANTHQWIFGSIGSSPDLNPQYSFPGNGVYPVTLIISNPCGVDTIVKTIVVVPLGFQGTDALGFHISAFPNPFNSSINLQAFLANPSNIKITLTDMLGKIVLSKLWNSISENNVIDVQDLPNGLYVLNLENEKGRIAFKLIRS